MAALRDLRPVRELDAVNLGMSPTLTRFELWLLPPRSRSSENMGAVRGEEPSPWTELKWSETLDDESDIVSWLDAGRLRLSS